MNRFTFSSELRLLNRAHFSFVFQHPKQTSSSKFFIIFSCVNLLEHPRIGLIIAKKNVKHSYNRNRIKRLVRESFRLHQHMLPAMDFVIVIRKRVENISNYVFTKALEKLWRHYCHLSHDF